HSPDTAYGVLRDDTRSAEPPSRRAAEQTDAVPCHMTLLKLIAKLIARVAALVVFAHVATAQAHGHPQASAERLGTVHFPTSCSAAVAPEFDRAVALLHSFEFGASIRAFNDVLAADSSCAMAYWGIALSRWTNPMAAGARPLAQLQQGRQAADAALRLSGKATER